MLGVSVQTLINWERRGRLHPRTRIKSDDDAREVIIYDPTELAAIPRKQRLAGTEFAGELAARTFEMFEDGYTLRGVVIETRQTPEVVETLYEQWKELGGNDLVITKNARAELARFVGAFESVTVLVEKVAKACGAVIDATIDESISEAQIERAINAAIDREDKT